MTDASQADSPESSGSDGGDRAAEASPHPDEDSSAPAQSTEENARASDESTSTDQPAGDEADGGDSGTPAQGEKEPTESDEAAKPEDPDRSGLEALEEDIRKVRDEAEDLIVGPDDTPAERYSESGEEGNSEDDQTITPPG